MCTKITAERTCILMLQMPQRQKCIPQFKCSMTGYNDIMAVQDADYRAVGQKFKGGDSLDSLMQSGGDRNSSCFLEIGQRQKCDQFPIFGISPTSICKQCDYFLSPYSLLPLPKTAMCCMRVLHYRVRCMCSFSLTIFSPLIFASS